MTIAAVAHGATQPDEAGDLLAQAGAFPVMGGDIAGFVRKEYGADLSAAGALGLAIEGPQG